MSKIKAISPSYKIADAIRDGWKGPEADRFVKWRAEVEQHVLDETGLWLDDLPDWRYASAYSARMTPKVAAKKVIAYARREMGV